MRKLIVFGNGLGRALDNGYFDLEVALQAAWDDPTVLDENQKQLIWQCLPEDVVETNELSAPKKEDELDRLQRVLAACDEISKCELRGGADWLNEHGKKFPFAIRSYVHRAACYFHQGDHVLQDEFTVPLIEFIEKTRSHIATLNYDELLYRAFIGTNVFHGYSCLLDGFVPHFDPDHLARYQPGSQSFYLHLHGSPLYHSLTDGSLHKSSLSALPQIQGHSSTHLVLTEVNHKIAVINSSLILRTYWSRLQTAMEEASSIVLFGYGGGDTHLNDMIQSNFVDKQIEVVERQHPEYLADHGKSERFDFWSKRLGKTPTGIFWYDNILSHTNWDWQPN